MLPCTILAFASKKVQIRLMVISLVFQALGHKPLWPDGGAMWEVTASQKFWAFEPEGEHTVCTKFHGNPSSGCRDISLGPTHHHHPGGAGREAGESNKGTGSHPLGTMNLWSKFRSNPAGVRYFQSGLKYWINRLTPLYLHNIVNLPEGDFLSNL